ncbi:MAG: hypothetical protein H6732_11495 [Alphaproteobacteria bacterium]|nr:hypothetical protein [Alphaproteobacteria bacterium]
MPWLELIPSTDHGPLLDVLVEGGAGQPPLTCRALLDTGASHSAVDLERVAVPLGLPRLDRRWMVLAEHGAVEVDVHEVGLRFPQVDLPRWWGRVHAMRLPRAFEVVVGMDVLDGTRLEVEVRGGVRRVRWSLLPR